MELCVTSGWPTVHSESLWFPKNRFLDSARKKGDGKPNLKGTFPAQRRKQ